MYRHFSDDPMIAGSRERHAGMTVVGTFGTTRDL
jgi:hypothetical protein